MTGDTGTITQEFAKQDTTVPDNTASAIGRALDDQFRSAAKPDIIRLPGASAILVAAKDYMDFEGIDVEQPQFTLKQEYEAAVVDTRAQVAPTFDAPTGHEIIAAEKIGMNLDKGPEVEEMHLV